MLLEFWENFRHNLFKPLLLFFYLGFFIPILKVQFEFPYVIYQAVTMYLLLAIGWHGGEELATIHVSSIGSIVGFIVLGFLLNFLIGFLAYLLLTRMTKMRRIDGRRSPVITGRTRQGHSQPVSASLRPSGWLSTVSCR